MNHYGGIVDSYATYVPDREGPALRVPTSDLIPTEGTDWCGVDERIDGDDADRASGRRGTTWSPSVCTSDTGIAAESEPEAIEILLDRHDFAWPETIGRWRLCSVRREMVMDDAETTAERMAG